MSYAHFPEFEMSDEARAERAAGYAEDAARTLATLDARRPARNTGGTILAEFHGEHCRACKGNGYFFDPPHYHGERGSFTDCSQCDGTGRQSLILRHMGAAA